MSKIWKGRIQENTDKAVEDFTYSIDIDKLRIYLRAFKDEKKIELWAKNFTDSKYKLIKVYKICRTSGDLGPKREQGDRQIPEGFYHINRFNPYSNFLLSLGLNYPNKSDRILGEKGNLGNDIFIIYKGYILFRKIELQLEVSGNGF